MARSTSASLGASSQIGGGTPSAIGGMIGVRPSFLWAYLFSIRSAVHGGTGIGVSKPRVNGLHPTLPAGRSTNANNQSLRRIQDMLPPPFLTVRP
jgi:hypothetical protein